MSDLVGRVGKVEQGRRGRGHRPRPEPKVIDYVGTARAAAQCGAFEPERWPKLMEIDDRYVAYRDLWIGLRALAVANGIIDMEGHYVDDMEDHHDGE